MSRNTFQWMCFDKNSSISSFLLINFAEDIALERENDKHLVQIYSSLII